MAALDAEIEKGLAVRETRRRQAAAQIVLRFAPTATQQAHRWTDRLAADALSVVISFEIYDALARAGHRREEIVAVMTHLARGILARPRSLPK
jgi:hypothetical protein